MLAPLLAGVAALFFAAAYIVSRRALTHTTVVSGLVVSLIAMGLVTGVAVAIDPPATVDRSAVILFALAGLCAPGISRLADLTGVQLLGPSTSVPIQSGVRPLLSVIGGVLILHEAINARLAIGVVAIVIGLWPLSRRMADPSAEEPTQGSERPWTAIFRPGVAFPMLAGVAFAASDVLKKEGLRHASDPTFGAALAIVSALVAWAIIAIASPRIRHDLHLGRGDRLFLVTGALTAFALISLFHALERGNVSVVGPIASSSPLAIFILSAAFLRDLEHVTRRTVASGLMVVLGASFVAMG